MFQVLSDTVHPSAAGHQQIGQWVADRLIRNLDNGQPLRLAPSGSYYIP